jgi:hypothetical protein
MPVTL